MPKQKQKLTQMEQSELFKKAVSELVADGELNPIEADAAFKKLIANVKTERKK